jgi:hypothetical protein
MLHNIMGAADLPETYAGVAMVSMNPGQTFPADILTSRFRSAMIPNGLDLPPWIPIDKNFWNRSVKTRFPP